MTTTELEAMPPVSETARWLRSLGSLKGAASGFDLSRVPEEPSVLFLHWLRDAVRSGVPEPHVATLSTVDADYIPDARLLLLKDVSADGWAVAGQRSSRKAAQLRASPAAALSFWWQPLLRAVRVRGTVTEASREQIEVDLAARPSGAAIPADDWMLWWIRPVSVEFWQGAVSRNHTRLMYEGGHGTWIRRTLGVSEDASVEGREK